jgi:tetratricopeptide (TPR) repeat protein
MRLAVVLSVVLTTTVAAAESWTHVASPHFDLYTTAGERQAHEALAYFERVRAFFTEFLKLSPRSDIQTRLIVFNGEAQFAPYRPYPSAGAFYQSGVDRDYVVMKSFTEDAYPIVVHEYAHLIFRHSGAVYPLWLNEGLADFFSTLSQQGEKMNIGRVPPGRLAQLAVEPTLLPLDRLFAVDHRSSDYRSSTHAGLFYSQSWALTHMLLTDERYRQRSGEFLRIISTGMPSAAALATAFERTTEQVMNDLRGYVRRADYPYFVADYTLPARAPDGPARSVDDYEATLVMTSLLANMTGRDADARASFETLARQRPDDLALVEARAFFEMRRGRRNEAQRQFTRAVALGSRNAAVYRDYAALDASKADTLLPKAIELAPEDVDLRARWATWLIGRRRASEAVATLIAVKQIPQESAFRVFQLLANAYVQLGRLEDARAVAAKVAQYAQPGEEAEFAARLIARIDEQRARTPAR